MELATRVQIYAANMDVFLLHQTMTWYLGQPTHSRSQTIFTQFKTAQSVEAVEYIDWISTERKDPPSIECPGYDIKQSDGVCLALEIWGMRSTPSLP